MFLGPTIAPSWCDAYFSKNRFRSSFLALSSPSLILKMASAFLAQAERPNQLWVSDLTYVSTWQGWLCVAFVIDVFARRTVPFPPSTPLRRRDASSSGAPLAQHVMPQG